jgi:hypothetical protein
VGIFCCFYDRHSLWYRLSDFLASENIYGLQATLQQLTECAAIITSDIIPSSGTSSLSDFAIKCSDSIDQTINRLLPDIMRHPLINRLRKALNFSEEHFVRLAEKYAFVFATFKI